MNSEPKRGGRVLIVPLDAPLYHALRWASGKTGRRLEDMGRRALTAELRRVAAEFANTGRRIPQPIAELLAALPREPRATPGVFNPEKTERKGADE